MNIRSIRKMFARSPATFRPMGQWSWNDRIHPERLAEQLDAMLDAGAGGALVRPGRGLPDGEYLSDAWFDGMSAVTRRARRRHGSIWLAEDFNDAFTREIVAELLREHQPYTAHMLALEDVVPASDEDARDALADSIAGFRVQADRPGARAGVREPARVVPIEEPDVASGLAGQRLLVFRKTTVPGHLTAFHADAMNAFLQATHERYYDRLKRYFGNTLGMCLLLNAGLPSRPDEIPWDDDLPTLLRDTRGTALIPNLPALFFDLPGHEHIRYEYWTLVGDMFREGSVAPFTQWCTERNMPASFGFAHAGDLEASVARGGSTMAAYAVNTCAPLCTPESDDETASGFHDAHRPRIALKEAQSVKRQIERYGVAWIPDRAHRPVTCAERLGNGLVHAALGVNFAAYPAIPASLRGPRKRDAGGAMGLVKHELSCQRIVFDALARAGWLLSQGEADAHVLLLHPLTSLQTTYVPRAAEKDSRHADAEAPRHRRIARHFEGITHTLLEAQLDFDYGDEQLIARHGSVLHRIFTIGKQSYTAVILPPSINLRANTFALLQDFAMGGGHLFTVGTTPTLVDGKPSREARRFFENYGERVTQGVDLGNYESLLDALADLNIHGITLRQPDADPTPQILAQQRSYGDLKLTALVSDAQQDQHVAVEFDAEPDPGNLERWSVSDGGMQKLSPEFVNERVRFNTFVGPGRPALLLNTSTDDKRVKPAPGAMTEVQRWTPDWNGHRKDPNTVVLRCCRVAESDESGATWTTPHGLRRIVVEKLQGSASPIPLRTVWSFEVAPGGEPPTECSIAVELGEDSTVLFNGDTLDIGETEFFLDPAIRRIPLPPLRTGENTLEIAGPCDDAETLQPPVLLGPFSVDATGPERTRIAATDGAVTFGTWAEQGLPAYAGRIGYRATLDAAPLDKDQRVRLELPGLLSPVTVWLDDEPIAHVLWPPYACDLTDHWRPGPHTLEIEVGTPTAALLQAMSGSTHDTRQEGLIAPPEIVLLREEPGDSPKT